MAIRPLVTSHQSAVYPVTQVTFQGMGACEILLLVTVPREPEIQWPEVPGAFLKYLIYKHTSWVANTGSGKLGHRPTLMWWVYRGKLGGQKITEK